MTNRNFYLSVLVVYAAGILCVSLLPDHSGTEPENLLRQMVFNFLHIPAYAGLAVLMRFYQVSCCMSQVSGGKSQVPGSQVSSPRREISSLRSQVSGGG